MNNKNGLVPEELSNRFETARCYFCNMTQWAWLEVRQEVTYCRNYETSVKLECLGCRTIYDLKNVINKSDLAVWKIEEL